MLPSSQHYYASHKHKDRLSRHGCIGLLSEHLVDRGRRIIRFSGQYGVNSTQAVDSGLCHQNHKITNKHKQD